MCTRLVLRGIYQFFFQYYLIRFRGYVVTIFGEKMWFLSPVPHPSNETPWKIELCVRLKKETAKMLFIYMRFDIVCTRSWPKMYTIASSFKHRGPTAVFVRIRLGTLRIIIVVPIYMYTINIRATVLSNKQQINLGDQTYTTVADVSPWIRPWRNIIWSPKIVHRCFKGLRNLLLKLVVLFVRPTRKNNYIFSRAPR